MSKFDRCTICDYSESAGSFYAHEAPSDKRVRRHGEEYYCDACASSIVQTYLELAADLPDEEDAPAVINEIQEKLL